MGFGGGIAIGPVSVGGAGGNIGKQRGQALSKLSVRGRR